MKKEKKIDYYGIRASEIKNQWYKKGWEGCVRELKTRLYEDVYSFIWNKKRSNKYSDELIVIGIKLNELVRKLQK